ncbi:hypothetical protein [Actinoplanes sp. NPDC051494]|uniref:hypothetical protein n=1 Tax=Actinoplanes sp. NPDC051494 TaxID=3363907 RepID=UPI0037AE1704
MAIFDSPHTFEVVGWGRGHAGLTVRGMTDETLPTRAEILFKPAYFACLPVQLDGLRIEHGTPAVLAQISASGATLGSDDHVYAVFSAGSLAGWVIGGAVFGRADHHRFGDPTMFTGWDPAPGVTALFSYVPRERPIG